MVSAEFFFTTPTLVLENYATLMATTTPRLALRNFTTLKQLQRQELALKKLIQAFLFFFSRLLNRKTFYFLIFQIHKQITGNHSLFQIKQHSVCKTKIGGIENVN